MVTNSNSNKSNNCNNDSNNNNNNKTMSLTNEFKKGFKASTLFSPSISPYGSSFRKDSFAASFGGDSYRNSFGVSSDLESSTISNSESMSDSGGSSSTGSSLILESKLPNRQLAATRAQIRSRHTNSLKPPMAPCSAMSNNSTKPISLASALGPVVRQSAVSSNSVIASGQCSGSTYGAPTRQQSVMASNSAILSTSAGLASNSISSVASGSVRQAASASGPAVTTTLRQQSAMGSGSLRNSTGLGPSSSASASVACSAVPSARPSAISANSIRSNLSKPGSIYKYDCAQLNTSEHVNSTSSIGLGKSPSMISRKSELTPNCGSVALPIFDSVTKSCTASKTSLSGKTVTLAIDNRGPRSSKNSNKLSSCSSLAQKSAFGSVKKSQSRSTIASVASSCKSATSKTSGNKKGYISEVENAILRSSDAPIEIKETEEIKALGNRGIWANKQEVLNWKGPVPICKYPINEDEEPQIIYKRVKQQLEYVQEMTIRYLRPPTPPEPGEIVIKLEANKLTPPAPPIVIRQQPPKPVTPEPLIIREAPPPAPPCIGRKLITIYGQRLPPPPRKVVIERLAPLPNKPQSVLIERWLPYTQSKRRVIFQGAPPDPIVIKPKNIVVQWETPNVIVRREHKHLGVIRANPSEYVQRYQSTLKPSKDLPQFVLDIKTPEGLVLAAEQSNNCSVHELEGDLDALKLVDLEREGLGEYKSYLQRLISASNSGLVSRLSNNGLMSRLSNRASLSRNSSSKTSLFRESASSFSANKSSSSFGLTPKPSILRNSNSVTSFAILSFEDLFKTLNTDAQGTVDLDETAREIMKINSRLGKHDDDELRSFINRFRAYSIDSENRVSLKEFKTAFNAHF